TVQEDVKDPLVDEREDALVEDRADGAERQLLDIAEDRDRRRNRTGEVVINRLHGRGGGRRRAERDPHRGDRTGQRGYRTHLISNPEYASLLDAGSSRERDVRP